MIDLASNQGNNPLSQRHRRHQQLAVVLLARIPGQIIEEVSDVGADLIAGEEADSVYKRAVAAL